MDIQTKDERLRKIYNENTPLVSDAAFARHVKEAARRKRPKTFGTSRPRSRIVLASLASVVILAAAAYGINVLVTQLRQDDSILVITDAWIAGVGSTDPSAVVEADTLTGVKAELWTEIQRIREGVASGELIFDWTEAEAAREYLPSDPMQMLDFLEQSLSSPDITVYMNGSESETTAFRAEVAVMPGVQKSELISREDALQRVKEDFADHPEVLSNLPSNPLPDSIKIWLTDYREAEPLADQWKSRPGVDEIEAGVHPAVDYAYWLTRLQSLTHPNDSTVVANGAQGSSAGTKTTFAEALATDDPALSSTTTIMGMGPILSWGEEAVLAGRTIKVEEPVEVPERTIKVELPIEPRLPDETGAPSRPMLAYIVYSLVTITNTGSEPLTCAAQEFWLMGNSSGSTGSGGQEKTMAGHEVLDSVTLQPGESVTRAVLFQIKQGDHPVKVLLGTRLSTGSITSAWLDCWQ